MGRTLERVARELGLDEQQRAQFDAAFATHRDRMREAAQHAKEEETADHDADAQGADLRSGRRPGGPESSGALEAALGDIEPILREDQLSKLWEVQDRMERQRREREHARGMIRDLPGDLDLQPGQRIAYQQLLNRHQEEIRIKQAELRPLLQQMREANEAGDTERLAELRETNRQCPAQHRRDVPGGA